MRIPTNPAFAVHACGCSVKSWTYPYRCPTHASLDGRVSMPNVPQDGWYGDNTCPFCGRVTPYGLACAQSTTCDKCGIRACERHDMAAHKLTIICPVIYHSRRTKIGRALYASLAALSSN